MGSLVEGDVRLLAPGTRITDKLELMAPLAEGGTATVWRVQNLALDCEVAVKFLSSHPDACPVELLTRFKSEGSVAAQVSSPYVVQTLDKGVFEGLPFIVMELVDGLALDDWLYEHEDRSPSDIVTIIDHIAKALTAVHKLQLVHRDVKPANVVVQGRQDELFAKLVDFGVAKDLMRHGRPLTLDGAAIGTPYYMSPEQITNAKSVDLRADVWALAVVAYEMLFDRLPFVGSNVGEVFVSVTRRVYRAPSELGAATPPNLDAFFARAFAERIDDRFDTAKSLSAALRSALATSIADEDDSWDSLTSGRALMSSPRSLVSDAPMRTSSSGLRKLPPPKKGRVAEAADLHVREVIVPSSSDGEFHPTAITVPAPPDEDLAALKLDTLVSSVAERQNQPTSNSLKRVMLLVAVVAVLALVIALFAR